MTIGQKSYTPATGWLDTVTFPTTPANETETRQNHQLLFDQILTIVNGLIATLDNSTVGTSGAENVTSPAITGVPGSNIYTQLVSLKTSLDGVVLGHIPDRSLSTIKIALGAITTAELAFDPATQAELDIVSDILDSHTAYKPNHVGSQIYTYNNIGGAF